MTEKEYELEMRILSDLVKGRGSNLTVDDGHVLFDILSRVEKTDLENDLLHAEVVLLKEDLRMMGSEKKRPTKEDCPFVECPLCSIECGSKECEKMLSMVEKVQGEESIKLIYARIAGAKNLLDDLMKVLKVVPDEEYFIISPKDLAKVARDNKIRAIYGDEPEEEKK